MSEAREPGRRPRRGPWAVLRSRPGYVLHRLWDENGKDMLTVVAAGVAFYGLLAIIPAIAALVTLYGLVSEPHQVEAQLREFHVILPPDVVDLLAEQLGQTAARSAGTLSIELVGAFVISLWSANRGMKSVMAAIHIAHGERERSFLFQNALGLVFTLGAIISVSLVLGFMVALPAAIGLLGLERGTSLAMTLLRWPILCGLLVVLLAVLYHLAPRRRPRRWYWVTPGAVLATVLWVLGSWLFAIYVTNFGNYARIYGSLGAVVTLLLWFFVSAYAVLLGAELNAIVEDELEPQAQDAQAVQQQG